MADRGSFWFADNWFDDGGIKLGYDFNKVLSSTFSFSYSAGLLFICGTLAGLNCSAYRQQFLGKNKHAHDDWLRIFIAHCFNPGYW